MKPLVKQVRKIVKISDRMEKKQVSYEVRKKLRRGYVRCRQEGNVVSTWTRPNTEDVAPAKTWAWPAITAIATTAKVSAGSTHSNSRSHSNISSIPTSCLLMNIYKN